MPLTPAAVGVYAVALVVVWFVAPTVIFCLWPGIMRCRFESGPEGVDAVAPQAVKAVIAELKTLGFSAIGIKSEQIPLRPRIRDFSFVAADGRCYASVHSTGSRAYYYTPLPSGGLVLTANGTFSTISSNTVVQRSFPGCGLKELLKHHHEALSSLGQHGQVSATQEARLDATYAYYRTPEVRSVLRRSGLFLLVAGGLVLWVVMRWR